MIPIIRLSRCAKKIMRVTEDRLFTSTMNEYAAYRRIEGYFRGTWQHNMGYPEHLTPSPARPTRRGSPRTP